MILKRDKPVTVTVDRLKPAVFLPEVSTELSEPVEPAPSAASVPPPSSDTPPALDPEVWPLPTRFGRRPRPPVRLNL